MRLSRKQLSKEITVNLGIWYAVMHPGIVIGHEVVDLLTVSSLKVKVVFGQSSRSSQVGKIHVRKTFSVMRGRSLARFSNGRL